jgi:DNA invertase Pin-like site-specific DNA recombinase
LGLEVSRLARNNADWHRLLEICAMSATLICDEDGLYDPTDFNDRLMLGLKGTMSEAELHFIRTRLIGGQLSKARRGDLRMGLPVGLVYDPAGNVVLDPDTGVQQAIRHVFTLFSRTGSARATVQQFNAEKLLFPVRVRTGTRKGELAWMPLQHWRVLRTLHNPPLPRRIRLRPPPRTPRRGRQEDLRHRAARAVDRPVPRHPPRLHQLVTVRNRPETAAGQCHRARRRPRRRARPGRHRAAAGASDLRIGRQRTTGSALSDSLEQSRVKASRPTCGTADDGTGAD